MRQPLVRLDTRCAGPGEREKRMETEGKGETTRKCRSAGKSDSARERCVPVSFRCYGIDI